MQQPRQLQQPQQHVRRRDPLSGCAVSHTPDKAGRGRQGRLLLSVPHIVLHLCNAVCGTDREVLCDTLPQRQQPQQPQQRQQRWWQASSQKQLGSGGSSGEEGHLSRCDQHVQSVPEARCAVAHTASVSKQERPMDEALCPGRHTSLRRNRKGGKEFTANTEGVPT